MPKHMILAFMAQLCIHTQNIRAAEGYLLELVALCAFAERDGSPVS